MFDSVYRSVLIAAVAVPVLEERGGLIRWHGCEGVGRGVLKRGFLLRWIVRPKSCSCYSFSKLYSTALLFQVAYRRANSGRVNIL